MIELVDLSSPRSEKSRDRTNVDKSPLNTATYTATSITDEVDIKNIFSINHSRSLENHRDDGGHSEKRTISEISDDIFLIKPEKNKYFKPHVAYKKKISEHLQKIREKASTPSKQSGKFKNKIPVENIRKESDNMNAEVEKVRNKFKLKMAILQQEKESFFNFSFEDKVRSF